MAASRISFLIGRRRRRRMLPVSPYKGKWQQTFNQQAALEAFKKKATALQHHHLLLSALLDAFSSYHCDPTPAAYSLLLNTLAHHSQLHLLPPLLHRIQTIEKFATPEPFFLHLIRIYGQARQLHEAVDIFFRIPNFRCAPSSLSLNALLSVLCQRREGLRLVPQVLLSSHALNIRLDHSTFRILISALCTINRVSFAIHVFNLMTTHYAYHPDSALYSLILSALCKIRGLSSSQLLGFWGQMRSAGFSPDAVDYTNVLTFLVRSDRGLDALDMLNQMKLDGIKPDAVCYTMVLDGLVSAEEYHNAEQVFDEILVLGVVPDLYTYNVYIHALCKQHNLEAAFQMLACMQALGCKPNVVTYNTLVAALRRLGQLRRAEEVLWEMGSKGVPANLHTYRILIDGYISIGDLVQARRVLQEMLRKDFVPRTLTFDDMICALCERGCGSEAMQVLNEMSMRNIAPGSSAWEALLLTFQLSFKETNYLSNLVEDLIDDISPQQL